MLNLIIAISTTFNLPRGKFSAYRSLAGTQYKIWPILGSGGEKILKNILRKPRKLEVFTQSVGHLTATPT